MTYQTLNEYIKHYLERDKTKSAIMLTGGWGTGKSHYIQNELVPFLNGNGKNNCVIVSLYGLESLAEISKSIYWGLRIKNYERKNKEAITTGIVTAHTIIKGVTSFFGVDISASEEGMQKIYSSIDLSDTLVILEDIERSHIDIIELLGFVNNLTDQDGVKVLLVANEEELINYESSNNQAENKEREYTETTKQYISVKEKTISDTIIFECDYETAVSQIIRSFDQPILNQFSFDENVINICDIFMLCNNYNLRSFIFACQKAADIFNDLDDSYGEDFVQCIFFSIIFFSLRLKKSKVPSWDGNNMFSVNLGTEQYPLFKFCYDYIVFHSYNTEEIPVAAAAFKNFCLYSPYRIRSDADILILQNYHLHYESDVRNAVLSITARLENPDDISFYHYGVLAVYLIVVEHQIGCEIEEAKKLLIENLKGRGNDLEIESLFSVALSNEAPEIQREFQVLKQEMESSLGNSSIFPNFNYLPEQVDSLCEFVLHNKDKFYIRRRFARDFDLIKVVDLFAKCTPEQKDTMRRIFVSVYRIGNAKEFLGEDKNAIEKLLKGIETSWEHPGNDKVQLIQYEWFIKNLKEILDKLA